MGFSWPMSSSLLHLAHSLRSVLMEQSTGPHGFPLSSTAGTLRRRGRGKGKVEEEEEERRGRGEVMEVREEDMACRRRLSHTCT
ncbi:hypothetical protein EYF80_067709 [Liparis tanakae]|uniref:Uncharacterized protein n=1 Tax=Liparis tanakae TaxID=230148 RepID=A0A4Z2E0D9_9TELE|nr:hypothetical protein EYF80_067709 [Liparis tanakae]